MARPALAALAEQQELIRRQATVIQQQATQLQAQSGAITQLQRVASHQRDQLVSLGRGLQAIAVAAGIESHVRTAMLRRADVQNPTQPVPEPPAEPPFVTTQEAETPEAFADVNAPGLVPGSTNDVAADATTTNYTPGTDIPGPAVKQLVDVTRPVDGTQGPRPLDEVRTLTDVRVGNPMNPQPAFPLQGPWTQPQRLGAKEAASNRTMASLRLARLRLAAKTAQGDSDFEVAAGIERDASMTTEKIEAEIATLEGVTKAAAKQQERPTGLVPRAAGGQVQRTVPSMQATAGAAGAMASDDEVQDSDLFD
jgi:hypothetical protein